MLLSQSFAGTLDLEKFVTRERFSNGRVCPHCGCIHVVRNGHQKNGAQRYVCRDCGKSFVVTANSIAAGTRKELAVWEKFIGCMMSGLSVRKTADACGIHRNTAFIWRHKVLDALQKYGRHGAAGRVVDLCSYGAEIRERPRFVEQTEHPAGRLKWGSILRGIFAYNVSNQPKEQNIGCIRQIQGKEAVAL